jgi:hypothetical protein
MSRYIWICCLVIILLNQIGINFALSTQLENQFHLQERPIGKLYFQSISFSTEFTLEYVMTTVV